MAKYWFVENPVVPLLQPPSGNQEYGSNNNNKTTLESSIFYSVCVCECECVCVSEAGGGGLIHLILIF